ncbi:hypothetical protein ETC01_04125 [Geobacillus sp. NFOSA3]|uniref:hypothetical protein n=1 Tax=Anoxybacillaceae TaxID=3120669 RepID=UPI000779BAEE|nr:MULTISPECIES: hypothetical protein [Bacillaceae]NNU92513.1 hypothetical protein [Geobacillus sp. NFOSA3]PDM39200.1 hypothetical protein CN643_00785 [Parageobacillus yumthangensis]RDV21167.1 hypothetical protein DXK91_15545 [Parageobacillus toebii]PUF87764.1 hypothetical protein DCC82_00730 [Geobacillus sp. LYN3]QXJ38811.1 hypothetical protein BV455_02155 [Parageobacillus caldoxylosilyticus]
MNPNIEPSEKLFRAVFPSIVWDDENNRPSSALFKDKRGVSVDRDGGRTVDSIISTFKNRFGDDKLKGVVYVNAGFCMDIGTHLVYCPSRNNKYHSEIHDSQSKVLLSSAKARKLALNCIVVYHV